MGVALFESCQQAVSKCCVQAGGYCALNVTLAQPGHLGAPGNKNHHLPATHVTLTHAPSGHEVKAGLLSGIRYEPGPRETWFSPLKRGQTYFRLTDELTTNPGSQWLFPIQYIPAAQLTITPEIITGTAIAHFKFTLPRLPTP